MDLQSVWDALKTVMDPEVHLNIVDMGLIYGVEDNDGQINVTMTLTTPGCPMSSKLTQDAKAAVESLPDVKSAQVNLVWDPRWSPVMMTDDARKKMGL